MSFVKSIRPVVLSLALALLAAPSSYAALFQSTGSGDWNNGNTWNQAGAVPGSGDTVEILDTHTVTVTTTTDTAASVSFGTLAFGATLQINPGAKLTIVGNIAVDADALGAATLDVAGGTLVAGGSISITEGSTGGAATLRIGAGSVSCGNVTFSSLLNASNTRIEFTGAGLVALKGSLDSDGTLVNHAAGGGSTVKFEGSGSQTIGNYTYQNLGIANTSALAVEAGGAFTVNGTLAMQSGSFLVKSAFSAGATSSLQMLGTSVLKLGDATVLTGVTMPSFGTYTLASTSTIYYGAGANQTINETVPYKHLIVAYTGSTQNPVKQFGGNATILGDLTIDQQTPGTVTLEVGSGIVTVAGSLLGDGGLTFGLGGELRLAGDFTNSGTFSGGTGLFTYNGGQFQSARPVAYNELYITGTNTNATLSSNGGSAVTLTIDGNSYFDLTTSFTVSGDLTVNGFLNGTGDTLTLTGSGFQILGSGDIYAHVISGTRSIVAAADLLFAGNFTVNTSATVTNNGTVEILNSLNGTSATWINAANSSLAVGGNVMTAGTLNASAAGNTVSYNGLGQNVVGTTYHHLILTTTPAVTPGLKTMPTAILTTNGDLTISGTANVSPANAVVINGDFTLTGTATFDAGAFSYPVQGDWTVSGGTFTPGTSVVQFNGANQTINAGAFHHMDFDGFPGDTKTLTRNLDLSGDLAIFSGVSVLGGSYTINVAGSWSDAGSTFVPGSGTVIMDGSISESINGGTFHELEIAKSGAGSVSLAADVTVVDFDLASGTFDLVSSNLDVADDFTTFPGSTFNFSSGSVNAAGPISTSGTIIAGSGTMEVDGTSAIQTWGGSAPPLLHNLTVNKASGSLNPSVDLNVSGFLTLDNGTIVTGTNAVKVTSGQVLRTNGYVDGRLDVTHSTPGTKLYPLGTTLGYSPVNVTIANPGQLDMSIDDVPQPDNSGGGADILQSYWTIFAGTVTGNVDLTFSWPAGAVNGTEANYVLARHDGASWTQPAASINPATHTATVTGVAAFNGDWTVGAPASVTTSYDLEITTDGNADAGVAESITITAKDGLGNVLTSYSGDHTLVFAGATTSPNGTAPTVKDKNNADQAFGDNTVLTFTAGVATTSVLLYTNESVALNASEPSTSTTGTQANITVAPGAATALDVSDVNAGMTLYANAPFTLAVTAVDAYGNPSNVVANTDVTLDTSGCGGCTGTLGGTLTLQIPAGNTTANFSALTYSVAEGGVVIDADATAGDSLASTNSAALTFTTQAAGVTVTTDANSGAGSLRDAINIANSGACGTPCNITFDILPAGPYTFQLTTRLPNITVPVVIDGNTQDGFTGDPILTIDGSLFTGTAAFEFNGGNSTLRGFNLQNLGGAAVQLASDGNVVQNCWIGTDVTGSAVAGNGTGISITGNNNTVGGSVAGTRNVISGNTTGILLSGFATGNTIRGNYIGTDYTGFESVGNGKGISLIQDAASNTIGGSSAADRNVISGNTGSGIVLSGGSNIAVDDLRGGVETTTVNKVLNNEILSNYIGVTQDGATALGNVAGIEVSDDAEGTVIGAPGSGNVISGNATGIILGGSSVTDTTIQSNLIGVAANGTTAAGNVNAAITLTASSGNLIGGTGAGEGNEIAHNGGAGVRIMGAASGNAIFGNAMHAYGTIAIDLDGDGADVQDAGDADTGANGNQNYPLISTANVNGTNLDVTFSVNSGATGAGSLRVELFEADGTGAPLISLGTACFAGNNLTNVLMTVPPGGVAVSDKVVATATAFTGAGCATIGDGTSEVSPPATAACLTPAVTITGPTSTCPSTPVTLDAGAGFLTYSWSTGDNTRFITVTPASTDTYTVTVTGANGCPGSDSHTVTLNTPTPVTITGPATACNSASLDAGAGFASYLWTTGATTRTISVTTSGTYGVTVTDANGCTATDSHTVTIDNVPGNTITASGPTTFCDGGSVILTASNAASWLWSTGATTQSITVTTAGSYSVQTTNGTCTATSAPTSVTVNPAPVVTITGPATACDSATLDAGSGYASYLWNTGDTTPTINVTATGSYSVTVTDANGCSGSDTHNISITSTPGNSVTAGGPTTFCDGGSVVLTASTANAYLWSTGQTTQSITVSAAGSYSVQTSNGSCTATSAPVAVTVNAAPVVTITGPISACDSATLNAGAGFASYLWSTGETTPTINVTASGTYSVTVTDANGCSGSDTHAVTITPTTPVTITGPSSACDSATLDAGSGFATYLWSTGATTQTINVTAGGTYSVTVTNGAGCSATDSHAITISNTLTPVITGPATACMQTSVTLDAGSGFTSYLWSTGDTTQTISVSASGTYSVTVTGAGGCSGSDSHTVTFNAAAPASITPDGPTTFCTGGDVVLTASAGSSWLWSNGATTQSITVATSGSFSVTVTGGNGCAATSAPVNVTVTPQPLATISAPSSASANASGLTASVPAQGGATYAWAALNATITSGQGTNAITFSTGSSGTAKLTVTVTKNGCPASSSKNIAINGGTQLTADLAIAKTAPATVNTGANLTYTLAVTNHGPSNATGVTITDALPLGTTLVSIGIHDVPWTCSQFSAGVYCTGDLAAGASSVLALTVTAPQQAGSITNTATVDSGNANDPVFTNNSSSATTVVTVAAGCSTVPPALVAPADGAQQVLSPVTFSWSAVTGASEYEVWLVTAGGTFLAGTTNTTSLVEALPSGDFGWYVVARFPGDCTPLVSAQRTFTVAEAGACTQQGPQLTAPAAGSTAGTSVTFTWTPVPGAIGYRVWVEANGTAAQDVGTTDGAISLTADVPAGALVAYVDAIFSGCPIGRSTPVAFNVAAPDPCAGRTASSPLSPSNGASMVFSRIDFAWTAANDADGYRLWAEIDGGVAEVLGETGETELAAILDGSSVSWWVEALYNGCASTESQRSGFTIPRRSNCSTQRPELTAPANNSTTDLGFVNFSWGAVPDAAGYEVWLAPEGGLPSLVATTTLPVLQHLLTPGRYEWFVRVLGDRCPPRNSQTFRFTYTPPAGCADNQRPIAIAPLSNARVAAPVTFSWSASPGASVYEVFAVRGNQTQLLAVSSTNQTGPVSLPNGRLRWFVRAHFPNGCSALESGEEKLEVVAPPAACTPLAAPEIAAVGQISSGVPFAIQWTGIAGATSYQLQLASDSQFSDAQLISTNDTKHHLTRTNLGAAPLTVYARARAIDSRCKPDGNITPYGAASAIFILPVQGTDAAAPVDGGIVTYNLPLGPELAGQSFTASSKEQWISVVPSSGVVPPGGLTLVVTANTTGLPLGTSLSAIRITLDTPASAGSVGTNATTLVLPVVGISKATPVNPTAKSAPPPDALIIPAVAHADGMNSKFQSDVRVTNTSSRLLQYQVTFTPSGGNGLAGGKQTTFSIEPGRTIALDDVLRTWFGTGGDSSIGTLEVRPLTQTTTTTPAAALRGLPNLTTFASSRTFNVTANGTFGQYIPAIPYANFIGLGGDSISSLSLQQIAQSVRYRTNLGIVEGSGQPASLMVKVFGETGQKLTEFPVQLKGGEHTQLNAFLAANGVPALNDGRVEISVIGGGGKVTAYASVLDNETNDPLLVTPVTITDSGDSKWVMPGVADIDNGAANWQTDMRVFNGGTEDVTATFSFYSQNGGAPKTADITIPAGQVRQFDRTLNSVFGVSNDGGAVHISTASAARLVATARTYNQTSGGTYGQFISAVTPAESASRETRALQVLQVEESARFRTNLGLAEVTGNPVTVQLSIVTPDTKTSSFTELTLAPNEFRQLPAILRSFGLGDTFNARITVRVIDGPGRVTAYGSMIDMLTNDPTYVPAQ